MDHKPTAQEQLAEEAARKAAASVLGVDQEKLIVRVRVRRPLGAPRRISDEALRRAVESTSTFSEAAQLLGCSAILISKRLKGLQIVRRAHIISP